MIQLGNSQYQIFGGTVMRAEDGFIQDVQELQVLRPELLLSRLLESLLKHNVINFATYQNARREIPYDKSTVSE